MGVGVVSGSLIVGISRNPSAKAELVSLCNLGVCIDGGCRLIGINDGFFNFCFVKYYKEKDNFYKK